jgi:RNA polymerase sigma-70 factor (ECF subfamily)
MTGGPVEAGPRRGADLRLVALRAGGGDQAALGELIRHTSVTVWRACAALVDRGSADDLTQDTYVRAIRSLSAYRGESDPIRWLLTIARRVCADEIGRRRQARQAATRLSRERVPVAAESTGEVDLADALGRLSPERREAFVLTAVAGFSYLEAAAVCECPVGTIRSRVARARADLIEALFDVAAGGSTAPAAREEAG